MNIPSIKFDRLPEKYKRYEPEPFERSSFKRKRYDYGKNKEGRVKDHDINPTGQKRVFGQCYARKEIREYFREMHNSWKKT